MFGSSVEDRRLIWRFKRGDKDALRRIYAKYKAELLKLAIALVGDVNAAEDLVQDVFVSFAQSAQTVRLTGSLRHFLLTCLANRARNLLRNHKRHETAGIDEARNSVSAESRPEQWVILSEELSQLGAAMSQLPYEQREVVGLYMQGDMTFRRIARIQNTSINTVQGRYRYGIKKLRSLLNGELTK